MESTNSNRLFRWTALLSLNASLLAGSWLLSPSSAAPPQQPFANPVEQRQRMIDALEANNKLLAEQNALLKSGKLKVQIGN